LNTSIVHRSKRASSSRIFVMSLPFGVLDVRYSNQAI